MKTTRSLLRKIKDSRVLVIGELMMDVYIEGACKRISPEAVAPVVDLQSEKRCLGGAANAAANLRKMGAEVLFCSVTGKDPEVEHALTLLEEMKINVSNVVQSDQRKLLVKTRVLAENQHLIRLDEGSTDPLSASLEEELIERIQKAFLRCDAVLISDYDKGVVTDSVISALHALLTEHRKMLAVDSKNLSRFSVLQPDLVKPNYEQALTLMSAKGNIENRINAIKTSGKDFFQKTKAKHTAVSMDKDGVCFFQKDKFLFHLPAVPVERPQVSGAGDTFISTCLLAQLAGASPRQSVQLAIKACSVAIQKQYTAVCTLADLFTLEPGNSRLNQHGIEELCENYRQQGKRIVFTNGCFDVLHSGHVRYLKEAKKRGDVLIVGINNDASVKRLKGSSRPVNRLKNRMEVLSELSCVDHVIPFGKLRADNPIELIKRVQPHVFVKGADYKEAFLPEANVLRELGIEIVFLPLVKNQSTSKIISRIRALPTSGKVFLGA